jgi:hypothetical protein
MRMTRLFTLIILRLYEYSGTWYTLVHLIIDKTGA